MVLDLGRFTRSGLLVDCVLPADTWAGGRSKEREESAKNVVEQDRETTHLSMMVK